MKTFLDYLEAVNNGHICNTKLTKFVKDNQEQLGSIFKTLKEQDIKNAVTKVIRSGGSWDEYAASDKKGFNADQADFKKIVRLLPKELLK